MLNDVCKMSGAEEAQNGMLEVSRKKTEAKKGSIITV